MYTSLRIPYKKQDLNTFKEPKGSAGLNSVQQCLEKHFFQTFTFAQRYPKAKKPGDFHYLF